MTSLSQFNHSHPRFFRLCRRRCPNITGEHNQWQWHSSSGYARGTAQIPQANNINDKSRPNWPRTPTVFQVTPEALPKSHRWMLIMTSLVPIRPRTSTVLQVTQEAQPKFHRQTKLMTSLVPIWPQNIHHPSSYAVGAAQIPQANNINDKSSPNSTKNIHNCSAG